MSVSYTHLDVYKRQAFLFVSPCALFASLSVCTVCTIGLIIAYLNLIISHNISLCTLSVVLNTPAQCSSPFYLLSINKNFQGRSSLRTLFQFQYALLFVVQLCSVLVGMVVNLLGLLFFKRRCFCYNHRIFVFFFIWTVIFLSTKSFKRKFFFRKLSVSLVTNGRKSGSICGFYGKGLGAHETSGARFCIRA